MKKTDKKIENQIISVLTEACTIAIERYDGFQWLTHFVNYRDFPGSLTVLCMFEKNEHLSILSDTDDGELFRKLIQSKLASIGVDLRNTRRSIRFDSQENGHKDRRGKLH